MEVFKTCLDKTLSDLVWPHSWPYFEQKVGLETLATSAVQAYTDNVNDNLHSIRLWLASGKIQVMTFSFLRMTCT